MLARILGGYLGDRLVPPAVRALTSAILFSVLRIIGRGMEPLTTGLLSDFFTKTYGDDGPRYAMLVVSTIFRLAS